MTRRHGSAAQLFEAALDRPEPARRAFVREASAGDDALFDEVMALLSADASAGAFLEPPAEVAALRRAAADGESATERDGDQEIGRLVGRYRLCSVLGRGGMGAVFLAERSEGDFEQAVAVKLLRRGMDTEDLLRRFEQERRLLARLDHPNIARLIDGGATSDHRPYLVMEYVDGLPLDEYCREQRLGVRARLELFLDVCTAVQHAHRGLVVHRDLKPSNILVAREGTVKLLDFGIAKVVDPQDSEVQLTATHVRLLSPRYASPEQVRGEMVTTASDVYSLGVVLYELLTGQSPYADNSGAMHDLERKVLETEPTPPSTVVTRSTSPGTALTVNAEQLRRTLRGDLDTIVLKAMRKQPERRYTSVDEFAEDLRRHLDGRPVLARPDSFSYRAGKFVRRNALAVTMASLLALALLTATAVSGWLFLRADRAQEVALAERHTAEQVSVFLQEMLGSIDPSVARGEDTALLSRVLGEAGERIDAELGSRPGVAASLHHTLGRTYHNLGELELAERHLERAHALQPDGPVGRDVDRMDFYMLAGRHEQTIELAPATLERARARSDVLNEARALYWWGKALEIKGDLDHALELLWQADHKLEEAGLDGARIPVLNGLASYLVNNRNDYIEADSTLALALRLVEHTGAGPLQTGQQLQALANSKRRQGHDAIADSLFSLASERYLAVLDSSHVHMASLQDEWAGALESLGRFDDAETLFRSSLRSMRQAYGDHHRMVGTVSNNLANVLRKTGRHDEAARYFDECLRIYRSVLGAEHAWVGIILGNAALNELARGRSEAALRTAAECRRVRALYWDEEHWRIAAVDMVHGAALSDLQRYDEAEPVLLDSLRRLDTSLGPHSSASELALEYLRDHFERSQRPVPREIAARLR